METSGTTSIFNEQGQEFVLGRAIGKGRTGFVRQCYNASDSSTVSACKTISTAVLDQPHAASNVLAELHAMETLRGHENIVQLLDVGFDDTGAHLVMEFCDAGSLFDLFFTHSRLTETQVAHIMKQLLLALNHCHTNKIVHRDVKPENILFKIYGHELNTSPDQTCGLCISKRVPCDKRGKSPICLGSVCLKLADFGFATTIASDSGLSSGFYGTSLYMAPEIISGNSYGAEVDMWSAGVVCFSALSGLMPFYGHDDTETFHQILQSKFTMGSGRWLEISDEAKDFLSRLLVHDQKLRMTADSALQHPWIIRHTFPQVTRLDCSRSFHELLYIQSPCSSLEPPVSLYSTYEDQQLEHGWPSCKTRKWSTRSFWAKYLRLRKLITLNK
eukprot:TRINITY_DN2828_c0_g1_i1.p1 TRINITY_DN2828_c0_g1~~TRINITY_DN2828_c0_g1_i1.p1  ORF type:complete len:387 (-),score=5.19 TRINITY_DN2828_c0_g1_i1:250-1410(-)